MDTFVKLYLVLLNDLYWTLDQRTFSRIFILKKYEQILPNSKRLTWGIEVHWVTSTETFLTPWYTFHWIFWIDEQEPKQLEERTTCAVGLMIWYSPFQIHIIGITHLDWNGIFFMWEAIERLFTFVKSWGFEMIRFWQEQIH